MTHKTISSLWNNLKAKSASLGSHSCSLGACAGALALALMGPWPVGAADEPSDDPDNSVTIRLKLQRSTPEAGHSEPRPKAEREESRRTRDKPVAAKQPTLSDRQAPQKPPGPNAPSQKRIALVQPTKKHQEDRKDPASSPLMLVGNGEAADLPERSADDAEPIDEARSGEVDGADRSGDAASSESEECPGSPESNLPVQKSMPDDVQLEQDEHPYDAPQAKSSADSSESDQPIEILLTAREREIQRRINRCLSYYLTHPESVIRRGPWALMHAILPFGVETEVTAGNKTVNAIGWMCYNGVCAKQRIFQPTRRGFRTNIGPGVQGHEGQFLAILAQSKVRADYPIRVGKRNYTINDLVKYEMATCREKSELTFKLIGLSHYLDHRVRWRDNRGRTWSLEKMVAEELAQPINGAACGGSHRLMGLSYAVIKHQQAGLPIDGSWQRADRYLNDYVNYAMSLQNPDGSFSTEWFESRGHSRDVKRQVQTTGHILEWLIYTLPDEHLRSPRIQLSVEFLLETVGNNPEADWPIGPRGHALRALALYSQRILGARPGQLKSYIAEMERGSSRR